MLLECNDFAAKYKQSMNDAILLDVRNDDEVAAGAIRGIKHIPLPVLPQRLDELDSKKQIFIYCRSGGRAQRAAELLQNSGFARVVVAVNGGYEQLKEKM